jgi:3-oxoacyl-[acyl-carrier protein] reductase
MDRFEEIRVGEKAEITHHITEDDLQRFVSLTGDYNPLHMNDSYAEKTTFKKRVVHGMLTASFISTIIGTKLPGKGALWFSQNLNFLLPARIGDTIQVEAVVKHKSLSNRIIVMEINIFNQLGQKLIDGEAKVKLLEEEEGKVMDSDTKGAAIITGASRGIGSAVALSLASDGYGVVINYRSSQEEAEDVLKQVMDRGGKGITYKADVKDYQKVDEMVLSSWISLGKLMCL